MGRADVFPILNCVDLAAAVAFYRVVFDGEVTYQYPPEGEPDYVTLSIGDGQVALGHGTVTAMYGATPRPSSGHAVDVCLYVPDLGLAVERARSAGAEIPVEPAAMPWGETVAYIRDPDGTMLLVIQASG